MAFPRSPRTSSAFQSTRSMVRDATYFFAASIVRAKGSIQSGLAPVPAGGRNAVSIQDACVGRIGETVFAVGHDASYIVAARHPSNNRKVTEYFYLVRSMDGPIADPSASGRGPFDAGKFEAERVRLRLPSFDTNMASLR